ncbi:hypothetical protein [Pseudanabaena biceps]|nr:hypothetical protein [Pseudanabaena biceps]ELS32799.1 hypothetical protein Pse7429DRAFT_2004 [Pseudanabaena biceps PCC 7429]
MKPLGYYSLQFSPETEQGIDSLNHKEAAVLMSITADDVYNEYQGDEDRNAIDPKILNDCDSLSIAQKISLIKALCDRIELKLMEVAK